MFGKTKRLAEKYTFLEDYIMGNSEKKVRNSNLEILRIISMILIVAHHYAVHGFGTIEMTYSFNRYVVGILSLGGKLGVACFVLISGYFMVYSKFTLDKLIKLVAETWFYAVGMGILFLYVLTPVEPIGLKSLIKLILPIGYNQYWFMTDYIMLMLISPALNLLILKMSKAMHRNLLIGGTILWSIMPSFTLASYGFNELWWFVVLYLFATYIRKYMDHEKKNAKKHLFGAAISYLLVIASNILLLFLGHITGIEIFSSCSTHFMALNSPFILMTAVELLIGFIKLKPHYNQSINKLASATLGVYLIHDNGMFRPYLWRTLLKNSDMYSNPLLIIHALVSIVAVYLICSCIDLVRQNTVERIFLNIVNRHFEQIKKLLLSIARSGCQKVGTIVSWYYK